MKRMITLILALVTLLTAAVGCGSGDSTPEKSSDGVSSGDHILYYGASSITTLNPLMANAAEGPTMQATQGTLYACVPDEDGKGVAYVPNLAANDPVSADESGTVWNIEVDPNAKWDNGDVINAETFAYSMRMELDPKLINTQANLAANNVITILNGSEYFVGDVASFDEVGFKAIDEHTIQVTTANACTANEVKRHFACYWTSPVHPEMYESCMNADRTSNTYGSSVEMTRFSGAFSVKLWVKGSRRELVRNESYNHSERIKLDQIVYCVVQGAATAIQMFEKGELDYITLNSSTAVQYAEDPRYSELNSRYIRQVTFCESNTEKPILGNENFKKAIYYGINRQEIAEITQTKPANFIVPYTSTGAEDGTLFRELPEVKAYTDDTTYDYNPELAVEYFNKALAETGISSVNVTLLHTSGGTDKLIGEYMQEQLSKLFGADRFALKLKGVPNATRINTINTSDSDPNAYEMALRYWSLGSSDYNPCQALVMLTSGYKKTYGWNLNAKIESLYQESLKSENRDSVSKLSAIAVEMEKEYINSCVTVPVTQDVEQVLISERVLLPLEKPDNAQGWCLLYSDVAVD